MTKKVVVMGGGNGTAKVLRALKIYPEYSISAVVSVSDSGGSSGRLRERLGVLPPGDILRAVLALSRHEYEDLKQIFYSTRFADTGELSGHNLGNLFLAFSSQFSGSMPHAIRALEQAVEAQGRVYPATLDSISLVAELSNGETVYTEGDIDRPSYDRALKIKKVWTEPEGALYEEAEKAIEAANYIICGPGSLYASIVATFLVGGMREAVAKSQAKIIYIAGNAYETTGETGPETLSGYVRELASYLPRRIDAVVYNNHELSEHEREAYEQEDWAVFPGDAQNISEYNVIQQDFEREWPEAPGLDPVKLGAVLRQILV